MDEMYWKMKNALNTKKSTKDIIDSKEKARVLELAHKRMKIVFAGALDEFERAFADYFAEDKEMHKRWKVVRAKILNNGNNQSRLLQNDLEKYNITPMRYHYTLKVVEKNDEKSQGNS